MKKNIVLLLVLLVLSACGGSKSASIQRTWKLISYNPASAQTPTAAGIETAIEFKDKQISGDVGCNSFGGDYRVGGSTITFGPIISTMMACLNQSGDQEQATLTVLKDSATFVLDNNTLTITAADGKSAIVLEKK